MKRYDRAYAKIHLDAIIHNIKEFKKSLSEKTNIMAIVKTDGYGHGAIPVAKAVSPYVSSYGVAIVEEGILLRNHGIEKPILVLGVVPESQFEQLLDYDITASIFQYHRAKILSDLAVKKGKKSLIHIAVDTGMSRLGLFPEENSIAVVKEIARLPGIKIDGIFTHFAKADEKDKSVSERQIEKFLWFIKELEDEGIQIPQKHSSNSAGFIDLPSAHMDLVRTGISMYGLLPSDEMQNQQISILPALELCAFISYVKMIQPGMSVSYGGTFTAKQPMKIATIPVGYGDGYPRSQSGKGCVLICGKRAPILGRVCMDQFMVDITQIPEAGEGSRAVLIGRDGEEEISVEEIARLGGGFHYEILCNISKRIPRVYEKDNKIIGTIDYFSDQYQDF